MSRIVLSLIMLATFAQGRAYPMDVLDSVLREVCLDSWRGEVAAEGFAVILVEPLMVNGREVGERVMWRREDGAEIRIAKVAPDNRLNRIQIETGRVVGGVLKPELSVTLGRACDVLDARRVLYRDDGSAKLVERLEADLETPRVREALDDPVPLASGTTGIAVAMVDSGVNYNIAEIAAGLARHHTGELIGYDFWDMDERPFDANPAVSPFNPQRHGTQTASLVLAESPVARIAPYRYPRPAMYRMADVIRHAAEAGVRIVNMSLGSSHSDDWVEFERAARSFSNVLFVVSAGNDGKDIDKEPVYPASLELENMLSVTSVDDLGRIAIGSNWGVRSVDLGVPAENVIVTDFYGRSKLASGSSYAAARVSALAACLLSATPNLTALELKRAIVALALDDAGLAQGFVAEGVLEDPDLHERGACAATISQPELLAPMMIPTAPQSVGFDYQLSFEIVLVRDARWAVSELESMLREAEAVLAQCSVGLSSIKVQPVVVPESYKYFTPYAAHRLVELYRAEPITVYLLKDTLREESFDAEAVGRSNSRTRPALKNTIWMTSHIEPAGTSLAHELVHILSDSGAHLDDDANLMFTRSSSERTHLSAAQCESIQQMGTQGALLQALKN